MHFRAVAGIISLSLFFSAGAAFATGRGNSIVSISSGIVSIDDFRGVTATSYMDIPYGYSTAVFESYRYFLTNHFAVGLGIGVDEVKGDLTYGNPKANGGVEGTAGTYIRHAYTIAPELFIKYSERGKTMLYGYCGIGYTFSTVEKAYYPEQYAVAYQNGVTPYPAYLPPYLSAQNPLYVNDDHMNFQVTVLGIRVGGKLHGT